MKTTTPRIFDTNRRIRLGIWGLGRGTSFYSSCAGCNVDVVAGLGDLGPRGRGPSKEATQRHRIS